MSTFEYVSVILTIITLLLIPALVLMFRGAVKWTRTEDRLAHLIEKVDQLVDDKDKVHAAILDQMRVDREATDKRLRFLEEFWMGRRKRM